MGGKRKRSAAVAAALPYVAAFLAALLLGAVAAVSSYLMRYGVPEVVNDTPWATVEPVSGRLNL